MHDCELRLYSLELRRGIDVTLEGTVVDIGSIVVHERKHGLVHGTIPLDVTRLSVAVSVHILVVLMVDRSLTSSPLSVSIGNRRVLGENTAASPPEKIWVINQGLGVETMVVQDEWSSEGKTTADTSDDEEADIEVCNPASNSETLDGKLTDDSKSEDDTSLSSGGVVGPVEVRIVGRSGNH